VYGIKKLSKRESETVKKGIIMAINILLTGFCGTSSEPLVKQADDRSLILPNDKRMDSEILVEEISLQAYDYIFSFGQKPNIKNKIYLETTARNKESCINTNLEYNKLKSALESNNIPVQLSNHAGTSFCNALYWSGLNYIYSHKLDTKMVFLHIPFCKNITDPRVFFHQILTAISTPE